VADLLLVSEDKASVLQVSPRDARGEAYGGFNYPWRIDEGMETLIAVMNPSESEEVNFSLFLFYGEQSYTYEGGRLRPGEVRWVDLRELRDRRIPDQMGRRLPHRVSAGQAKLVVHGIAGVSESQRIIGEAILVDRRRGIRVTMACPNCVSEPLRVEPGVVSVSGVVGERRSVTARVYYADGSSWVINDGRAIDWLESSVSVVQVVVVSDPVRRVDRFEAELRSPGTARIGAQVNHCWICTPCIDRTLALTPEIQVTVQPKVTVTGADICTDSITTRLEPSGVSGAFTLTLVSSAGSVTLVNQQMRAGGSYTDSFNVPTLPNRTFTSIQASWTVNGQTGTGSRSYSITVLGDYRNTCYITALETEYSGATVVAGTTTGPSQCPWSSREFIAGFLDAVNRNGSGIDSSGAGIQPESICTNPPPTSPAYNGRRYRRPTSIRTRCGNSPTVGVTVAASSLRCGTRVFINGIGCRIVQDTGNLAPNQLDHYLGTGNALCSRWPNPTAKVVRIN
jgi:3D (Asp-Asp-Asp) domain-containing protein